MVSGWIETTELSSLIASSTTSRLAAFLRSRIAVLKSLFVPLLNKNTKQTNTIRPNKRRIEKITKNNELENKKRDPMAYESEDSG